MERPPKRELYNNIQQARDAVSSDSLLILNPEIIAEDAIELGYLVRDLRTVLLVVFDEIKLNHYAGSHPPKKSYEAQIKDSELFAFRWKSKYFGCEAYIKYCLKGEQMYLVSFHQHRMMKGG